MRLLPRRAGTDTYDVPTDEDPASEVVSGSTGSGGVGAAPKGRPTPKRRDADPKRGPVAAPKTRKEAAQRQRQQMKQSRRPAAALTPAQRRQRILAGDQSALPRRDVGPLRALARDYVDSHRMLSNWLLILFPLILVSAFLHTPVINLVILGVFLLVLLEWMITGRRLIALADARQIDRGRNTAMGIGFYAGTRAYLPRKWRVPRPRVGMHEEL